MRKDRSLAHIVKIRLGTQEAVFGYAFYQEKWPDFQNFSALHFMINHRSYLDKDSPIKEFDEHNIWKYNKSYGELVRGILRRVNLFILTE